MRRIRSHKILAINRVFKFGNKGVRYTILTPRAQIYLNNLSIKKKKNGKGER